MRKRPISERFAEQVDQREANECWPFTAQRRKGYGRFWDGRRLVQAHRVAWELKHGTIPEGLHVLHHCDNRPCCNPQHLFLGTNADNVADRQSKGRHVPSFGASNGAYTKPHRRRRGENHGRSKVTADDVRAIRANVEGISQAEWGRRLGISQRAVGYIVQGKHWADVGP